jgi:hypothetical protein
MNSAGFILHKMLVKAFYRQQAGFFLFIFLVFFGIVQPSTQIYFHYSLIRGMLETPAFMALVGLAWVGYGLKVRRFVTGVLENPGARLLYKINALPPGRVLRCCWLVQMLLFLPVLGYALIVAGVATHRKQEAQALGIVGFVLLLILLATMEMRHRLKYPGSGKDDTTRPLQRRFTPYWSILLRYLFAENAGLLAVIKVFGCALLYLFLRLQDPGDYDLRMPFLAYSLAIFGHGILLYHCRQLETTRLVCYRSLPVSVIRRFGQYGLFCFLLLIPETGVLGWLTPHPIQVIDSLAFMLSGYSLLLLLNSLLLAFSLTATDYLKACLALFGILYCCVLGKFLIASSGFCIFMAAIIFFRGYARYETR